MRAERGGSIPSLVLRVEPFLPLEVGGLGSGTGSLVTTSSSAIAFYNDRDESTCKERTKKERTWNIVCRARAEEVPALTTMLEGEAPSDFFELCIAIIPRTTLPHSAWIFSSKPASSKQDILALNNGVSERYKGLKLPAAVSLKFSGEQRARKVKGRGVRVKSPLEGACMNVLMPFSPCQVPAATIPSPPA